METIKYCSPTTIHFEKKKDELRELIERTNLERKLPHISMKIVRDGVTLKLSRKHIEQLIELFESKT